MRAVELDREPQVRPVAVDLVAVQRRVHDRLGKPTAFERGEEFELAAAPGAGAAREVHRDRLIEASEVAAAVRALARLVDGGEIEQVMELGLVDHVREFPLGHLIGEIHEQARNRRRRDAPVDGHVARVQVSGPVRPNGRIGATALWSNDIDVRDAIVIDRVVPAAREVTERRARPGGQDRGHPARLL